MFTPMASASATTVPSRRFRSAFVTGATGFVGANLTRALLGRGIRVRALVRRESEASSLEGLDVTRVEGDLHDERLVQLLDACDVCFHAAAALTGAASPELRRTNVEGTRRVLEAAARAGCTSIVHVSTVGTLARLDGQPVTERDPRLLPGASEYVRSKFEGDEAARSLASGGAPVVIVHPSAPVGPHDRTPTVTGRRIVSVLEGSLPRWIAGAINHVHVRDVAEGMILAAERGEAGTSYLLAHAEGNLTRDEFVERVARAASMSPPRSRRRFPLLGLFRRARAPDCGPVSLACDPTWTIERLGLPQTPLDEAFREAVAWFRARGA
jgi:dihydroflavonol-4-reductase